MKHATINAACRRAKGSADVRRIRRMHRAIRAILIMSLPMGLRPERTRAALRKMSRQSGLSI